MEIRDLRIGNKVFSLETQQIQTITGVVEENVYLDCITFDYVTYEEIEPIELTDKDVKQYGHFNLIKVNDDYFVCFGNYKTQIKFYHELQNYYYLVNHEEL